MIGPLHRAWSLRTSVVLALLLSLCGWIYRDALLDIVLIGSHRQEQGHIFLAPLIAAWLFWLRRGRLRLVRVAPSFLGPIIIGLSWVLHWWAIGADNQAVWHASALIAMVGCVVTVAGPHIVRRFGPAFAALLFLIPVPGTVQNAIGIPLQAMATGIMQFGFDLLAIPVVREGFVLTVNGEQIAVAEACNGMRMVFALALVVYAFVFSVNLRLTPSILVLGLSPFVALLCNIIRLLPTTLLYGYTSPGIAEYFHDLSGWVMLPVALAMLVGVLRLIRWIELPVTPFRLATP